jgi:uncharacterized membrane protein required for colicin V production
VIDLVVLGVIGVAALFGLIRGIISQIMGLAGLVGAYLLAPAWGKLLVGPVQAHLGCSKFMAEKFGVFLVGFGIYLGFRLVGFAIEKLFFSRIKEFKVLNRFGGAILGAAKAAVILAIVFFFVALVPKDDVHAWFPKLVESRSYQLAAKYNPMGKQAALERMRRLRTSMTDPKQIERLQRSDEIEKILSRYELKGVLSDQQFMDSIRNGDYDALQKNEQVEKLMKDKELTDLLEKLEKEPPA